MSDTRVQDCPEEAFVIAKVVDHTASARCENINKFCLLLGDNKF